MTCITAMKLEAIVGRVIMWITEAHHLQEENIMPCFYEQVRVTVRQFSQNDFLEKITSFKVGVTLSYYSPTSRNVG